MRALPVLLALFAPSVTAAPLSPEAVALTDHLGHDIDASERARYHLFPDIEGFVSARIVRSSGGAYLVYYTTQGPHGPREHRRAISGDAFEATREHARLVERSLAAQDSLGVAHALSCIEHTMLLLASAANYDAALHLADAALDAGRGEATALRQTLQRLSRSRGLFAPGALYDHSGRTELLVFSGYYGLWLGIATPIAAGVEDASGFGASLLLIPTASVLVTSAATRRADVSDGRAGMISLGGHLGTWQGLGWASLADEEGRRVVGIGVLAGMAGIGTSTLLTRGVELTPGHAEIANSGLPWGAWLGAVVGEIAGHDGDGILRDMLIGSDLGVVTGLLAGRDSPVSRSRVRLCNMAGVLGAMGGLGVSLILDVDEEDAAIGVIAAGSLVGLSLGIHATAHMGGGTPAASDRIGRETSSTDRSIAPRIGLYSSPAHPRPTPALELALGL